MTTSLSAKRIASSSLRSFPPPAMDLIVPPPPSPFVLRKRQRSLTSPPPTATDCWDSLPRTVNVPTLFTPDPAVGLQWSPACIPEVFNPSPMLPPASPVKPKREFGFNYLPGDRPQADRARENVRSEDSSRETSVGLEEFDAGVSPSVFKTTASTSAAAPKNTVIPQEFSNIAPPQPANRPTTWATPSLSLFTPPSVVSLPLPAGPAAPLRKHLPSAAFANAPPPRQRAISKPARAHACARCPARFRMRGDLKRHVRTVHERERAHVCGDCGRSFGHSGHLNRHVASVHLNVRAHACGACGDRFFQASHLRSHIAHVHASGARFACALCKSCLATAGGLRSHMRSVHGAREDIPCRVPGCREMFVLEADRERHVRRRHARD